MKEIAEEQNGYVVFKFKISADLLGNRVVHNGRRHCSACPHLFQQQASGYKFKDDVNGFSSTSVI
jgi:hypothetical protein